MYLNLAKDEIMSTHMMYWLQFSLSCITYDEPNYERNIECKNNPSKRVKHTSITPFGLKEKEREKWLKDQNSLAMNKKDIHL